MNQHFTDATAAADWVCDDFMPRHRAAGNNPDAHLVLLTRMDCERLDEAAALLAIGAWWRDLAAEVETIALEG